MLSPLVELQKGNFQPQPGSLESNLRRVGDIVKKTQIGPEELLNGRLVSCNFLSDSACIDLSPDVYKFELVGLHK